MKLIENQDYRWNVVKKDILSLKNHLGFTDTIQFLLLEMMDDGIILFYDPRTMSNHPVQNKILSNNIRKILFYYSQGDERYFPAAGTEVFTKISLLDDSMHLGCSTNQHRLESEFRILFEKDQARMIAILENYFGGIQARSGDISYRMQLLPMVEVLLVFNKGDEMPGDIATDSCLSSSITIFFEKNTIFFLPPNVCETLEEVFVTVVKWLF